MSTSRKEAAPSKQAASVIVLTTVLVSIFALIASAAQNPPRHSTNRIRVEQKTRLRNLISGPTQTLRGAVTGGVQPTAEILLTPVANHPEGEYGHGGYYSDADINGQRLSVSSGGGRTFWNMQLRNWGPARLRSWEGRVDASTFLGANADCGGGPGSCVGAGDLLPANQPCTNTGICIVSFDEVGSLCDRGVCDYAWINGGRDDIVFRNCGPPIVFDCIIGRCGLAQAIGPNCFSATDFVEDSRVDDGRTYYGATLALDVPDDARGLYTIGWIPELTRFQDDNSPPNAIPLAAMIPGELSVQTGACCLGFVEGGCIDGLLRGECNEATPTLETFHPDRACSEVFCNPRGACCRADPQFPSALGCSISVLGECDCTTCDWTIGRTCGDVDCRDFVATIKTPALSQWSLATLALTLLAGLTIKFGQRVTE